MPYVMAEDLQQRTTPVGRTPLLLPATAQGGRGLETARGRVPGQSRLSLSGQFASQWFPVPYSSLGGNYVSAPGVISSEDMEAGMSGVFTQDKWVVPPFRSTPQAVLGLGQLETVMNWLEQNKAIAAAGAVALFLLFSRRR